MAKLPDMKTTVFGSIGAPLTCPQCQGEFVTIRVEMDLKARTALLNAQQVKVELWPNGYVVHAEPCGHRVHEGAALSGTAFDESAEIVWRSGERY